MDEKLRLDYEQTTQHFMMLADTRLKLVVFVPALSALAIAFLAFTARPGTEFVIGILGLVMTVVIALYGLRNAKAYDAIVERGRALEKKLDMPSFTEGKQTGGIFNEKPANLKLLGQIEVHHKLGFGLLYAVVFGAWVHRVIESMLGVISLSLRTGWISIPVAVVGSVLFLLVFLQMSGTSMPRPQPKAPGAKGTPPSAPAKPAEAKPAASPSAMPSSSMPPAAPPMPAPAAPETEEKGESPTSDAAKQRKPRAKKSE